MASKGFAVFGLIITATAVGGNGSFFQQAAAQSQSAVTLFQPVYNKSGLEETPTAVAVSFDSAAFDRMAKSGGAVAQAWPLPGGRFKDVRLWPAVHLPIVDAGTQIVLADGDGRRVLVPLPSVDTFYGEIVGEEGASFVHLSRVGEGVYGSVQMGDEVLTLAPIGGEVGQKDGRALTQIANANNFDRPTACAADLMDQPGLQTRSFGLTDADRARFPKGMLTAPEKSNPKVLTADRQIKVSFEATVEFTQFQGGSAQAAAEYLVGMLAEVNAIYVRDLRTSLKLRGVRAWQSEPDPYNGNDVITMLNQLTGVMISPNTEAVLKEADLVMLIHRSRTATLGGVAYVGSLCKESFVKAGFNIGVTDVEGTVDWPNPSFTWDVNSVAHEFGHGFGSVHTHCYDPPIDKCFSEPNCHRGPIVPEMGTIMSYCHLVSGGTNFLRFHPRTQEVMRAWVLESTCATVISGGQPTPTVTPTPTPLPEASVVETIMRVRLPNANDDKNTDDIIDVADVVTVVTRR